jgi:phosphotransferase system  glucose/maltose/N-acetylglucosamine-specific IIC component
MPWRLKQKLYMIAFGLVAIVLAIIVIARNESLSTSLLGGVGIAGGCAMILLGITGWRGDLNGNDK